MRRPIIPLYHLRLKHTHDSHTQALKIYVLAVRLYVRKEPGLMAAVWCHRDNNYEIFTRLLVGAISRLATWRRAATVAQPRCARRPFTACVWRHGPVSRLSQGGKFNTACDNKQRRSFDRRTTCSLLSLSLHANQCDGHHRPNRGRHRSRSAIDVELQTDEEQ